MRNIIASNLNRLVEKAEDPEQMIRQLIRDMDESIISLRLEVAKAIAAEKRLGRRIEVTKKTDAPGMLKELEHQHEEAARMSAAMKEQLQQLENKIQEARRKREILIVRRHRAEAEESMINATEEFGRVSRQADSVMELESKGIEEDLTELKKKMGERG
ncbi:PspA/IM30 family protein [Planctomycetota bacterium]